MGFRFRKSINLGGGFRINISKSGIGYSWGIKGYRITKTSKGTIRRTTSIPGTGISYVEESSDDQRKNQTRPINYDPNIYNIRNIENASAQSMVSAGIEDLICVARRSIRINHLSTLGLWLFFILGCGYQVFFILFFLSLVAKIYIRTKGRIDLEYEIDESEKKSIEKRMEPMIRVSRSEKLWRIVQSSRVIDKKYEAGAASKVKRVNCRVVKKIPFPFKTNTSAVIFKYKKESLIFLPDSLFIMQGSKIGALSYLDIIINAHTTRFIESERVPKDAKIVGETWKYVNKSGGPDRRFKNNPALPICLYGELELHSASGLDTIIMFSNVDLK